MKQLAKGWSKGGGGGRRVESAKRQRGQIPWDSVLSSGAASTPGTRKSGEGVNGRDVEGWREWVANGGGRGRTNQLDACALGCPVGLQGFPWHSP